MTQRQAARGIYLESGRRPKATKMGRTGLYFLALTRGCGGVKAMVTQVAAIQGRKANGDVPIARRHFAIAQ